MRRFRFVGDPDQYSFIDFKPQKDIIYDEFQNGVLDCVRMFPNDWLEVFETEPMVEKPNAWDLLRKANKVIQSMKLSMLVHPDCSRDSEFYDICQTAQEMEDEIDKFLNETK